MSSRIKPWRKKDNKHLKRKPKKKLKFEIAPDPPRYEIVNGQYVRVR